MNKSRQRKKWGEIYFYFFYIFRNFERENIFLLFFNFSEIFERENIFTFLQFFAIFPPKNLKLTVRPLLWFGRPTSKKVVKKDQILDKIRPGGRKRNLLLGIAKLTTVWRDSLIIYRVGKRIPVKLCPISTERTLVTFLSLPLKILLLCTFRISGI